MIKIFVKTETPKEYYDVMLTLKNPFPSAPDAYVENEGIYVNISDARETSVTNPLKFKKPEDIVVIQNYKQFEEGIAPEKLFSNEYKGYYKKYEKHPQNLTTWYKQG